MQSVYDFFAQAPTAEQAATAIVACQRAGLAVDAQNHHVRFALT